jgi:rhamnogalacturonan endolyase
MNHMFTFHVPTSAWKTDAGQYSVLKLGIVSGSTGSAHPSPGTSFDCIDLLT